MARDDDEIIDQFLGSDSFPVTWDSEAEKKLFWVFDDLHCPHPVSPMFFDIGGWWLSCDHMFRRFGTPFACDWLAKCVNGYLYTAIIPAEGDVLVDASEYGARYSARVPRDPEYSRRIGTYLDAVLPTYALHFASWWRDRLVPEMLRNFAYLEDRLDKADDLTLMELATLLEDAIDIHDRHWKIHWMLNFGQLSATLHLRALMEKHRGRVDATLLGRLQNSGDDRNWDSIRALWQLKEEAKADPVLLAAFKGETAADVVELLNETERGRTWLTESVGAYQREYGYHAVWSHEFIFPTVREQVEPVLELVRGYIDSDYDCPATIAAVRADIEAASRELLEGLSGEALEELRAANEINLRMAPLTPDHHFYIDQGANAHVRLVLMTIGGRLVGMGALDEPDDIMFLRYNELRLLVASPDTMDVRSTVERRREERAAAYLIQPADWIGTATPRHLAVPYLSNWGYPDRLYRKPSTVEGQVTGIAASPGVVQALARVVLTTSEFDQVQKGEIVVCQMTNPAWVALFTKMSGLVTDSGGLTSHPAVLAREFGIPAVIGTSSATRTIKTGDRIRVNGSTGVVEILREGGEKLGVGSDAPAAEMFASAPKPQ